MTGRLAAQNETKRSELNGENQDRHCRPWASSVRCGRNCVGKIGERRSGEVYGWKGAGLFAMLHRWIQMNWVAIVWSMSASACLTLAALHLLVWCKQRTAWPICSLPCAAATVQVVLERWQFVEWPQTGGSASWPSSGFLVSNQTKPPHGRWS